MQPAVTMTLAGVLCQVRSSDVLEDARTSAASSRGPRPLCGLDRSPQQVEFWQPQATIVSQLQGLFFLFARLVLSEVDDGHNGQEDYPNQD